MPREEMKITLTCSTCGSTDIANLTGPDDAIVTCNGCQRKFGTSAEVREKVAAGARARMRQIRSAGARKAKTLQ